MSEGSIVTLALFGGTMVFILAFLWIMIKGGKR